MKSFKNVKTILLLIIVVFLLASTIYLGVTIQDQSNNTGAINTRASDDSLQQDDTNSLAYRSTTPGAPTAKPLSATPTKAAGGPTVTGARTITTAPTTVPKGGITLVSPTIAVATTVPTVAPTYNTTQYSSPTPIAELPVTGIEDAIVPFLMGGGVLILVAFLL